MTEIERVRGVVNWLIFKGYAESEKDIAIKLGYTASSFSQLLNGRVPLSKKFIRKLASANENINELWILGGEGKMLRTDALGLLPENLGGSAVEDNMIPYGINPSASYDAIKNTIEAKYVAKIEKLEAKIDEKDEQIGMLIRSLDKLADKFEHKEKGKVIRGNSKEVVKDA